MWKVFKLLSVFFFALFLAHCNNDSEEPDAISQTLSKPLTISNLLFGPDKIYLEPQLKTFTISGTINFENAAGGLDKLQVESSDGVTFDVDVSGVGTIVTGVINGYFEFTMPEKPTDFTFEVWVTDKKGRISNRLSGSFSVVFDDRMLNWIKAPLPDPNWRFQKIVWAKNKFVAVGNNGVIATSPDGYSWTLEQSGTNHDLFSICWAGSKFVAVGEYNAILSSPDGSNWQLDYSSDHNSKLYDVAAGNSNYVAIGRDSVLDKTIIMTSTNGNNWTESSYSVEGGELKSIAWSGKLFIAVGNSTWDPCCRTPKCICGFNALLITSPDGATWTRKDYMGNSVDGSLRDICWDGNKFIITNGYRVFPTLDGTPGTYVDNITTIMYSFTYSDKGYLGLGTQVGSGMDGLYRSQDGLNWTNGITSHTQGLPLFTLTDLIWSGKKYIATGVKGYVLISPY